MSCGRLCHALVCLAAALSLVPSARGIPMELLATLGDKSICQSVVIYDRNPDRIPRIIKEVKCAESPDKMCPARNNTGGEASCCKQNTYGNHQFSCEEVIDSVMVSDISGATTQKTVSIGCACVMKQVTSAQEVS